ncbi:hypothetical protein GCM10022251_08580 [Phytohabitans flavus]
MQAGYRGGGALLVAEEGDDGAEAIQKEAPQPQLRVGQERDTVMNKLGHGPYAKWRGPCPGQW